MCVGQYGSILFQIQEWVFYAFKDRAGDTGATGDMKIKDLQKIGNSYKKLETLKTVSPVSPDDGSFQLTLGSRLAFANDVRC